MKGKDLKEVKGTRFYIPLVLYDFAIFLCVVSLLFVMYKGGGSLYTLGIFYQSSIAFVLIFATRLVFKIYRQVWRYGGIQCYIKLLISDTVSFLLYFIVETVLPIEHIIFAKLLAFCCMNTLGSLTIRMLYRYAYKLGNQDTKLGFLLRWCLKIFTGGRIQTDIGLDSPKIKIAIIGAGSVGVGLVKNFQNNRKSQYIVTCFIDNNLNKVGRDIHGIPVLLEDETTLDEMKKQGVQEVVFAILNMDLNRKLELYDFYQKAGFKVKVFDFRPKDMLDGKRELREFEISDLLMRSQKDIIDEQTKVYFKGKKILITGGGGSIGSELCRQLAKMEPKQLIVLDVYENCAYDLQQEIAFAYKDAIDIKVEIVSIRDQKGLTRVFKEYQPDICINAAAHKHVPLMEKNCIEAVENNVFGTLNVIHCCEEFSCGRFIMVSTDKAVNPTNVMGATKRMCEMIMQAYSSKGIVKCSATRFGNVLGSAGSVIPLFKRQIQAGGPVTVTDKRIVRYFMTIPEASQLVLTSGAIAKNGQLFILDMGKPVKIYDLALNMIAMSGMHDIDIVETGLRPGEKLYEELLLQPEKLEKTENDMIFIENEAPISMRELEEKLRILRQACESNEDDNVREALRKVVPTFKNPKEINSEAEITMVVE